VIAGWKFHLRGSATVVVTIVLVWLANSASLFALTLYWTGNSANADGIYIQRADSSSGPWAQLATVAANATNFNDTTVTCGVGYYYRARAYNSAGVSGYSNVAGPASDPCCNYNLTPATVGMTTEGGSGSFGVTVDNTCSWTATSNIGWINITSGGSGAGNGTVNYSVAANTGSSARTGTVSIADQTFTVVEAGTATSLVAITNAVDMVGGIPVVLAGDAISFNTGTIDNSGNPMTYAWSFGDGSTSTDSVPQHAFAECGPYNVSVAISDGLTTSNANLNVAVPCTLSVTNFRASLKFGNPKQDKCSFKAVPQPSQCTNWLGTTVTLDVGGAQVSLTLDAKGRGISTNASCRFSYNKRTGVCELTAKLSRGTWRDVWATYGLVNSDTPKPGASVTLPVTLMINDEAFMADKPLQYIATANKSGAAK
jgi:hypothetical protein